VALRYGAAETPRPTPRSATVSAAPTTGASSPSGGSGRAVAATCTLSGERTGYNKVRVSDVNINIKILTWTVNPDSRSCSKRWDLEPVMTHE
jgi:hypothetical protein